MLKAVIRCGAAVTALILVGLVLLQVMERQETLPLSTSARVDLNFESAGFTPQESREQLSRWAQQSRAEIYLIRPGAAERETNLYSLGASQPAAPQPLTWLDPGKSGAIYPASAIGSGSMSGTYVVSGTDAEQGLWHWLHAAGIRSTWAEAVELTILFRPIVYLGTGLTIVAAGFLLLTLVAAWYASRAEHRATRVLAGTGTVRIQIDDACVLLANISGPAAATSAASLFAVGLFRGLTNATQVAVPLVICLLAMIAGIGVCGVVLSLLTWPRVNGFAARRPTVLRFELTNQLLKGVSLALALSAVPFLVSSISEVSTAAAAANRAQHLQQWMSVAVGGLTPPEYDKVAERVGAAITTADQRGTVAFSSAIAASVDGYGGVILVDRHYLSLMSDPDDIVDVAWNGLSDTARRSMHKALAPSLRQGAQMEDLIQVITLRGGTSILAQTSDARGLTLVNRPLVLVTPHISALLSNDALASAITTQRVLFNDRQVLIDQTHDLGTTLTFSPAASYAILYAQAKVSQLMIMVATLVLLVFATATALLVSGSLFAARNTRRLFPRFLDGQPITKLLGGRLMGEGTLMMTVLAAVSSIYLWFGAQSYTGWLLIAVITMFCGSWAAHGTALRRALRGRAQRHT